MLLLEQTANQVHVWGNILHHIEKIYQVHKNELWASMVKK